jgi:hypothetical protein
VTTPSAFVVTQTLGRRLHRNRERRGQRERKGKDEPDQGEKLTFLPKLTLSSILVLLLLKSSLILVSAQHPLPVLPNKQQPAKGRDAQDTHCSIDNLDNFIIFDKIIELILNIRKNNRVIGFMILEPI